jgi:hypothetical protein
LAELYADQGLFGRAVEVYEHLVKAEPGDPDLQIRLEELESLARPDSVYVPGSAGETSDPSRADTDIEEIGSDLLFPEAVEFEQGTLVTEPSLTDHAPDPPDADAQALDEDLEALAADLAAGPEASDVSTPFAWSEAEPDTKPDEEAGRPVAEYLNDLLTWQPAEPVAEEQSQSVDDAISISALAPDSSSRQEEVAIERLHEHEIVPIASLAPGAEPGVVPIESLAPSSPEEGGTERTAQFQDWMRRLRE